MLKEKNKLIKYFSITLILGSVIFLTSSILQNIISNNVEERKVEEFLDTKKEVDNSQKEQEQKQEISSTDDDYIAILEIPKINLKKGLYDKNNNKNNVEYNIQILTLSDYPNISNGNFILASHNGSYPISYFRELYKLSNNDKVYVYYDSYKYEYVINKIYDIKKTGKAKIERDVNQNTITLITCKRNTNMQTIFIGYMVNKYKY